ncbi:MAG TPA: hypothetical protein VGI16_15665 [Candidatus Acidoferrum sp.]|jgi:hypothetical protein
MSLGRLKLGLRKRQILAILGCVALLYLAAGGSFLHAHTQGHDNPCHICQSVHIPALAAAAHNLIPDVEPVAWHCSVPLRTAPTDSFDVLRASRAPPAVQL